MSFVKLPSVQIDDVQHDYLDATQGKAASQAFETFELADGETLTVKVDGGSVQTITFYAVDFDNIAEATAEEVAASIEGQLVGGAGEADGTAVVIKSDTYGSSSSIQVTGGTANAELQFLTTVQSGTDATGLGLINRIPEPDETDVLLSANVILDVFSVVGIPVPPASSVTIYIDGNLAVLNGVFQSGYDGPGSTTWQYGACRFVIDPTTDFDSDADVTVRVVVVLGPGLDATYSFHTVDQTAPGVSDVLAIEKKQLQVTFNEPVVQTSSTGLNDSLNPDNYIIDRNPPAGSPAVDVEVVSVTAVSATVVVLTTDIVLTFGQPYLLTVENVEDLSGNVVSALLGADVEFDAFSPLAPANRRFFLWDWVPDINKREDSTGDLSKFFGVLQEIVNLITSEIDYFEYSIDVDRAAEQFLEAMLWDLGNPFSFAVLSETDMRRLIRILVPIYRLKGTASGIISVVRFFLGLDVTIEALNRKSAWILGGDATQASLQSGNSETFALSDGQTLIVRVDDTDDYTATFNTADFVAIGAATAQEVADVIDADITDVTSAPVDDGTVLLQRDDAGSGTSIQVIGGTANPALGFPTTVSRGTGSNPDETSELGEDTYLAVSSGASLYTFEVHSSISLSTDQQEKVLIIANYMKAAHEHAILVLPEDEEVYDHLELGVSELGRWGTEPGTWILH